MTFGFFERGDHTVVWEIILNALIACVAAYGGLFRDFLSHP
jgi:hypothetical protein